MARRGGPRVRPYGINGVKVPSTCVGADLVSARNGTNVSSMHVGADLVSARHEACPPVMAFNYENHKIFLSINFLSDPVLLAVLPACLGQRSVSLQCQPDHARHLCAYHGGAL